MKISDNTIVKLEYTLMNENGEVLESSSDEGEYEYLHGSGDMLPGVEKILSGMEAGQSTEVTLSPEDGFGLRDDDLIFEIERAAFPSDIELEKGMEFDVEDEDGFSIITVLDVEDTKVLVDKNHPLAGQTLKVKAKVLDVREAEEWEIQSWGEHDHDGCCGHDHHHEDGECCGGHDHEDGECCGGHGHESDEGCGCGHKH